MALTLTKTTFEGDALAEAVASTVLRGQTIERDLITQHDEINYKKVIPLSDSTVVVGDSASSFSGAGTDTFDEKYLEPKGKSVQKEIDWSVVRQWWFRNQNAAGRGDDFAAQKSLEDVIVEKIGSMTGAFIDSSIWNGSTYAGTNVRGVTVTGSNVVSGLIPKMEISSDVNKLATVTGTDNLVVAGISKAAVAVVTVASTANLQSGDLVTFTGVATDGAGTDFETLNGKSFKIIVINATTFSIPVDTSAFANIYDANTGKVHFFNQSNAISVLSKIYRELPLEVMSDPDFYIYGSEQIRIYYSIAQANVATGSGSYYIGQKEMDFLGQKLAILPYIKPNTIVCAKTTDLHFGTSLSAEWNNVNIVDMRNTTNENKIRYRTDFAFDAEFTNDKDIVLYRPA
jgi:hypothetical protein